MARNLITDVAGVQVGNAGDARLASGVTVILFDAPVVASIDVRGGGPGTRESDLLDPARTVEGIDAIVLSGGSAFGLDAPSGVQAWLREQGRGFEVREALVPIVPGAILFDLLNGGDKTWGRYPPYRELGTCRGGGRERRIRAGQRRRWPWGHDRQSQGRPRLGVGGDARRVHRRRAGRRQCGRQRHRRRRTVVLGRAVRAGWRIRRTRVSRSHTGGCAGAA